MNATILSIEDYRTLKLLNTYLIKKTGIDFLKKLADLGNSETKTELDAKQFIKDTYPFHVGLSPEETGQHVILLMSFYFTVEQVHDSADRAVTFGECVPKKTPWEDNFRAKSMQRFLLHTSVQEQSMAPAFFPLS